jgi:outer membrane protein TolC
MARLIVPVLAALSLAACATTPTVYQPALGPAAVGYSEYRIEPGRYRITFRGGPGAPVQQVSDYALLRAADLALAEGYDWFRVADRIVQQEGYGSGPRVSVGAGGADWGRRSSVGVGLGTSFDLGGGPAFSQTLEVVMGKGPPPRTADVYDARAIRNAIGARA